jgi:thioredoxin 1
MPPTEPRILDVHEGNFTQLVLERDVPVLVDFTAVWCPPCRAIKPHLATLAQAYAGRVDICAVDADENAALAARYDVRSMPTLLLFRKGQVVGQIVGAVPRARIEALITGALAAAA